MKTVQSSHLLAVTNYLAALTQSFLDASFNARLVGVQQKLPPTEDPLLLSQAFIPGFAFPRLGEHELLKTVLERERPQYLLIADRFLAGGVTAQVQLAHHVEALAILSSRESPYAHAPAGSNPSLDQYVQETLSECDGILAVSERLKEFWLERGFPKQRIHVARTPVRNFSSKRVSVPGYKGLYAGNLFHDEAFDLIEITALVRKLIHEFELTIYADDTPERMAELRNLIEKRGLGDAITIKPPLSLVGLFEAEVNADVLLLPRRSGEFSQAGFPNKLGEYLMSGTPVVCTAVGDIGRLLRDKKEVFLVPPDNISLFAESVVACLEDRDRANKVALQGKEWVLATSGTKVVGADIVAWLDTLTPRKDCAVTQDFG